MENCKKQLNDMKRLTLTGNANTGNGPVETQRSVVEKNLLWKDVHVYRFCVAKLMIKTENKEII